MARRSSKLIVDVAAMARLHHVCDGCTGRDLTRSCCARFDVWVTRQEMRRITGLLPDVAAVCPHLREDGELDNVFEDEGGSRYSIDKRDDGLCTFAFEEGGMVRCGIHAAAAANGLDGFTIKPLECTLWPFTLTETEPWVLSVDEEATAFHCCKTTRKRCLDPTVIAHLQALLGAAATEQVVAAAREGREEIILGVDFPSFLTRGIG